MDKGAHFYKCDFQVHTPRDINWSGEGAITEDERKLYSEEFIFVCRQKGLDSVAITDHHDFAFFKYIKDIAENELDDSGNKISKEKQIAVFPGLELTLSSPPCQAILILDANFPVEFFDGILHALCINPNSPDREHTAEVRKITREVVDCFEKLYQLLNNLEFCKDKFIILPNVSEGGNHTLLRSGFQDFYKKMPCVGGYLDGPISQLGEGNKRILNGLDRNYGFKKIAYFQTSDNRRRDYNELGRFTTWVKWAEPTAEAIRQACLADSSRLRHEEPNLPNIWIKSLKVSNSKFMGPIDLELNQQYNAIIGGRGTGKSTILEYLRWCLCDQPPRLNDFEDISDLHLKRQKLIENTLVKIGGEVKVTFILNDILHIAKRDSVSNEVYLKIGDNDFEPVKEDNIRNLLPIQAYSQKQLSSVGVRIDELKRFIEKPISQEMNQIRFNILDLSKKIKNAYNQLIRKKEIEKDIAKYNLEISSLNVQVSKLRKELRGVSEEDKKTISNKPKIENEESFIEITKDEFERVKEALNGIYELISNFPEKTDTEIEYLNADLIKRIYLLRKRKFVEIKSALETAIELLDDKNLNDINRLIEEWKGIKNKYHISYEEAKKRTTSNKKQLDEIRRIEERLNEIRNIVSEENKELKDLGEPETEYKSYRDKWINSHKSKLELLTQQCDNFNTISNGCIKVQLEGSIDLIQLKKRLKESFEGMRIIDTKVDALCDVIKSSSDPNESWEEILKELESLSLYDVENLKLSNLPSTSILDSCNFKENEKNRIVEKLSTEKWLDLSTIEMEFAPIFLYGINPNENDYISFQDASTGQQATALLTVLLNQTGYPLIIDQPEDDIDNRAMDQVTQLIWNAKENRQLIFSSHNANLVVNGDAELVICCDYRTAGDQSGGKIKNEGAIDITDVKNEITTVMEGGEKAFKLRKDKYGF